MKIRIACCGACREPLKRIHEGWFCDTKDCRHYRKQMAPVILTRIEPDKK